MSSFYRIIFQLIAIQLTAIFLSGCVAQASVSVPVHAAPASIEVPAGHLPPPGTCRIWYPDMPPGQQSPPGDCYDLERRVPPGAVLVRG